MKPTLTILLFLTLIATITACKKEAEEPCPMICFFGPEIMPVNLEDASGHDLLNGAYKRYDTSQVKVYFKYEDKKVNIPVRCDSMFKARINAGFFIDYSYQNTYYVEIQGNLTHTISFTYDTHADRCYTSYSLKEVFVNGVATPLRENILPLVLENVATGK